MNTASVGKWLVILGLGSFALNYFGYELKLLAWVDAWGASTAIMIRMGCVALGVLLMFLSRSAQQPQD